MKKKIPVIGAYLLGLLMVFVGITLTCSSCKEKPAFFGGDDSECESDSILVAQYIDRVSNPTFINIHEVLSFRDKLIENAAIDSLITALPEKTLTDVAGVVINKNGVATKKQIAEEYRANQQVYNNLPDKTTDINEPTAEKPTQTEAVQTRVVDAPVENAVKYNYRDTVINGKKIRIETKTIEYE